jgi:hypothetical protein
MARIAEAREGIEAVCHAAAAVHFRELIFDWQDRELISSYRGETQAKLKEIAELSDPNNPRVFHATRCSVCGSSLDLPAVHFMCNHSYHSRYVDWTPESHLIGTHCLATPVWILAVDA